MKKVLVVLTMVALTFGMNAQQEVAVDSSQQEFSKGFPYEMIDQLVGKRIKGAVMKPTLQKYGFSGLYRSESMKYNQRWKENDSYNTEYSEVSGKIFTVVSVEPYVNSIGSNKYKVELLSEKKETIWLDYSPKYSHNFYFLVEGGFEVSDEYFCSKFISSSYDDFEEETTVRSDNSSYRLIRVGNSGGSVFYLSASVGSDSTAAIGGDGFYLILQDGTKLSWPDAKLDTEVNPSKYGKDYIVDAFVKLTEEQLRKISTSDTKKAKFYVITKDFADYDESEYTRNFRCVIDAIIK